MSLTASNVANPFRLVLSDNEENLRAYLVANGQGWVAWAPYFFRVLRREQRVRRSHLELTDDVVSTLYDPRDESSISAVYSLANVQDEGLFQLYGGRGIARQPEAAVRMAERASARLISALKGRFRKSIITPLDVQEANAYYRHLLMCKETAAVLGHPLRRLTGAAVSGDGVGQLIAADAQEQLEVIAAGLEDVPFAIQTILSPYSALEITTLLKRTADELSRFASMINGGESINLSISPGALLTPMHAVVKQDVRSTGISHVDRREALESQAHELAASRGQGQTGWEREAETHQEFTEHTDTQYAAGAHISEQIDEHEEAEIHLERDYADRYNLQRSYSGVERATLRTTAESEAAQQGNRQQNSETQSQAHETGQMTAHESADTAVTGNRGASGHRSGSGNRSGVSNYAVSGQVTTVDNRTFESDLHQATDRRFDESVNQDVQGDRQQISNELSSGEREQSYNSQQQGVDYQRQQGSYDNQGLQLREGEQAREVTAGGASARVIPVVEAEHTKHAEHYGTHEEFRDQGGQESQQTGVEMGMEQGNRDTAYSQQDHAVSSEQTFEDRQQDTHGQGSEAIAQNIEGTQRVTTVSTQSGGGTRTTNENYGYSEAYQYNESYHDNNHMERDSQRDWESDVERQVSQQQQSDWEQGLAEQRQGIQRTTRSYGGSYSESGVRSGHLSQHDQRVTDKHITRETNRQETGWRSEDRQGVRDQTQTEQGQMAMEQKRLTEADAYQRAQSNAVAGETGSFAGQSRTMTRGYAGPSGAGLFVGLGSSRQTKDTWRELLAALLAQQQERLARGRNGGFFRNQTVLMAPDDLILERLIGAAVAAWREDGVVAPVAVRPGDQRLWQQAARFLLDERREDNPVHPYAFQQGMTSNEVATIVHPIRIEGKGGTTSSLSGWPDILGLDRGAGELEFGYQISPATDATTNLALHVKFDELMHILIVGASGSGKSNSALHIISQIINHARENLRGRRQPVPLTGGLHVGVPEDDTRPAMGVTVLDPTGEWRRLAALVLNTEFKFYSLTDPDNFHLGFNPVAIPSRHISPKDWISAFAKRWAMAYATGATGVSLMRKSMRRLYAAHEVFEHPERSQSLTMVDLHAQAMEVFDEMKRNRQIDNISPGVLKRILDKMEEFQPGGLHHEAFGEAGKAQVEDWLWPYGVTVVEGDFGDDEMLKAFIIGLLGMATYQHSEGKYKDTIKEQGTLDVRRHMLVFEEAHVIMQGGQKTQLQGVLEKTAGLWDHIADRGRKYGLYAMTVAQHWQGLPEGIVGSARMVIAQGVNTQDDAEAAAAAVGFRPGRSSLDEVTQIVDKLLDMPVGCGVFKRKRLPKQQETRQKAIAVQFPDLSSIEPPTDGQLRHLLRNAEAYAALQRDTWPRLQMIFDRQPEQLIG